MGLLALGPSPPALPPPLSVDGSIGKGILGLRGRGSGTRRAELFVLIHLAPLYASPLAFPTWLPFSLERGWGTREGVVMTAPTLSLHRIKAL